MNLNDTDKKRIIELIKAGEKLPKEFIYKLFADEEDVFLFWNGRKEDTTNIALPFHSIEHIDEPRREAKKEGDTFSLFETDYRGRQLKGWTNKLIWGDNKLILSSLAYGPLREEIEKQGGLKFVYIDPPFDVGDDFTFEIEIGKQSIVKTRNALEQLAFSDTWGRQEDSFLSMIYERLKLISNLMSNEATIMIHCDTRVNYLLRAVLDEIFGKSNFLNEIVWKRASGGKNITRNLPKNNDHILWYSKSENYKIYDIYTELTEEQKNEYKIDDNDGRGKYITQPLINPGVRPTLQFNYTDNEGNVWKHPKNGWRITKEKIKELENDNRLVKKGTLRFKQYLSEKLIKGSMLPNNWTDITGSTVGYSKESANYPTQKPEKLLDRILSLTTAENDLVADFFCGSGTTLAVAEKLNRKWIGCDLGKFAIHTSRKRLINIQREKEKEGKHFRPFEVLNLGKYQREFFVKDYLFNERALKNEQAEEHYYKLILDAYKAKKLESLGIIKGIKNNRAIAVGPFNLQVTRLFVEEVIKECALKKITTVDILGFEFEMGLFPNIRDVASKQGIDLNCLYIPNDIFDKKAVKKHQIIFYNTAYIDAQIITKKDEFVVKLKGYSVFDSDNQFEEALSELEKGEKREILMKNSIIKIHKDKDGKINKNIIKMKWDDWVDYWSVDFDFENKKEIIKEGDKDKWTGDFIFENEWQSFRTKESDIDFETPLRKIIKGKKIAVKVIDIFGNDTMKILEL